MLLVTLACLRALPVVRRLVRFQPKRLRLRRWTVVHFPVWTGRRVGCLDSPVGVLHFFTSNVNIRSRAAVAECITSSALSPSGYHTAGVSWSSPRSSCRPCTPSGRRRSSRSRRRPASRRETSRPGGRSPCSGPATAIHSPGSSPAICCPDTACRGCRRGRWSATPTVRRRRSRSARSPTGSSAAFSSSADTANDGGWSVGLAGERRGGGGVDLPCNRGAASCERFSVFLPRL